LLKLQKKNRELYEFLDSIDFANINNIQSAILEYDEEFVSVEGESKSGGSRPHIRMMFKNPKV